MSFTTVMRRPKRVVVDPNGSSRLHPDWIAALLEDADEVPSVGETVTAVQPDPEGVDFVGHALVKLLDLQHGLIYLDVDWNSFTDQPNTIVHGVPFQVEYSFGVDHWSGASVVPIGRNSAVTTSLVR